MCSPIDFGCKASTAITNALFGSILEQLAEWVNGWLTAAATYWIRLPSPDFVRGAVKNSVVQVQSVLQPIQFSLVILSIIITAIMMIVTQKGEPLKEQVKALLLMAFVTAGTLSLVSLLLIAGDSLADFFLDQTKIEFIDGTTLADTSSPIGVIILLLVLGLLGLIQVVMMVFRNAILIIVVAVIPISAGLYITKTGKEWFNKLANWLLAAILYKPVAALIYLMIGSMSIEDPQGTVGTNTIRFITSMVMLLMAIFALPALMKLLVPAVAAATGGAGGGAGMGALFMMGSGAFRSASGAMSSSGGGGTTTAASGGGTTTAASGGGGAAAGGSSAGAAAAAGPAAPVVAAVAAAKMAAQAVVGTTQSATSEASGENGGTTQTGSNSTSSHTQPTSNTSSNPSSVAKPIDYGESGPSGAKS